MIITANQVREACLRLPIPREKINIWSSNIAIVDDAYMIKHGKKLGKLYFDLGLNKLTIGDGERFDCDGFCMVAAGLARLDHAMSNLDAGIGLGLFPLATETLLHCVIGRVIVNNDVVGIKLYEGEPEGDICLRPFKLQPLQYFACWL